MYVVFRKHLEYPDDENEDYDVDVQFCCICKTEDEAKRVCEKKEKEPGRFMFLYNWEYAEVAENESEGVKL